MRLYLERIGVNLEVWDEANLIITLMQGQHYCSASEPLFRIIHYGMNSNPMAWEMFNGMWWSCPILKDPNYPTYYVTIGERNAPKRTPRKTQKVLIETSVPVAENPLRRNIILED